MKSSKKCSSSPCEKHHFMYEVTEEQLGLMLACEDIVERVKQHKFHNHSNDDGCCIYTVTDILMDYGILTPRNQETFEAYELRKLGRMDEQEIKKAERKFRKENK